MVEKCFVKNCRLDSTIIHKQIGAEFCDKHFEDYNNGVKLELVGGRIINGDNKNNTLVK